MKLSANILNRLIVHLVQGTKPRFQYHPCNEGIRLGSVAINLSGVAYSLRIGCKLWLLAENIHTLDTYSHTI